MMVFVGFSREDLILGIREVIGKLSPCEEPVGIRIVGGAALALIYFDRRVTTDIDAQLIPEESVLRASRIVAEEQGWPDDWLNSKATMFIPSFGVGLTWQTIYEDERVKVSVASPKTLLAMKVHASRLGRDVQDIANLLAICGINDLQGVGQLMDEYYPGEGVSNRAHQVVSFILERGIPPIPPSPNMPIFD